MSFTHRAPSEREKRVEKLAQFGYAVLRDMRRLGVPMETPLGRELMREAEESGLGRTPGNGVFFVEERYDSTPIL